MISFLSWYRELCCKISDSEWQPSPSNITTKTRVTPNLLRLTWNGYPLHHHSKLGWGYLVPKDEYSMYF
jgi:DNA polymerase gamma 1